MLPRRSFSLVRGAPAPLMRDWIHAMLYDPVEGYFAKSQHPVSPLTAPVPFNELADRQAYLQYVAAQYTMLNDKWLTPSEIFSPLMGRAIANYIAGTGIRRVVEIGSGSGTLAIDIITHLKTLAYGSDFSYRTVEISKALSETQQARLLAAGHGDVYRSCHADATRESTWREFGGPGDQTPTLILAMEVLDNLPHDKVVQVGGIWHQTRVDVARSQEILEPVADDEPILRVLDAYETMIQDSQRPVRDSMFKWLLDATGTPDPVWLPTGCMSLLNAVRHVPNHELLFADFDFLPNVAIAGENAPIVSSTVDGKARDRGELLSAPFGSVDIFFPTNFRLLSSMYGIVSPMGKVRVEKAGKFFQTMLSDEERERGTCKDGLCPLIEDYENTSFAHLSSLHV